MPKSRRRHSAEFKFKVAPEAAKGLRTINEIASEFSLHPNRVNGSNICWRAAMPYSAHRRVILNESTKPSRPKCMSRSAA